MLSDSDYQFAHRCAAARSLASLHLPVGNSLIRFDLIIAIVQQSKSRITVKEFFAEFNHSQTAFRSNLKDLIIEGWIELSSDPYDRRRKIVRPTQKLIKHFEYFSKAAITSVAIGT